MVSYKQMKYASYEEAKKENRPIKVLCDSIYLGYRFIIIDYNGSHPCAYIDVGKNDKLYRCNDDVFFPVHGGITYGKENLRDLISNSWVIGWDYNHSGDRGFFEDYGETHTTFNIIEECMEAIEYIKEKCE